MASVCDVAIGVSGARFGLTVTVDAMLSAVLEELAPECLVGHYHDTGGWALTNTDPKLARGVDTGPELVFCCVKQANSNRRC
ncbi:hypothetical protein [Albidovulum sp.]|uniref:hypothetical protein n=1 Tax=Albidovulum sp. TaxID=1872424 RepID=UPI003D7D0014